MSSEDRYVTQRVKCTTRPSARGPEHSYIKLHGIPPGEEVVVERTIKLTPRALKKGDRYVYMPFKGGSIGGTVTVAVYRSQPGCGRGKGVFALFRDHEFVVSAGWRNEDDMRKWLSENKYVYVGRKKESADVSD